MNIKRTLAHTRTFALATLAASLLLFACGDSSSVDVTGDTSSSMSAVEATDACFTGCMERPEASADRCAEACAEIGGDTCQEGCVERGGDEADCDAICRERDGVAEHSCYEGCIERGGDEATCEEACTERERLESSDEDREREDTDREDSDEDREREED